VKITRHAIERYQERIANIPDAEVCARILDHLAVLEIADRFGAPVVKLANGVRFMVKGGAVTTVLSPDMRLGPVQ
jgi:hypothetical protein